MNQIFEIPESLCPFCGYLMSEMACANKRREAVPAPRAGDFSVCFACLEVSVFDSDLELRKLTLEEHRELFFSASYREIAQVRAKNILARQRRAGAENG